MTQRSRVAALEERGPQAQPNVVWQEAGQSADEALAASGMMGTDDVIIVGWEDDNETG